MDFSTAGSGGARPKILVGCTADKQQLAYGTNNYSDTHQPWIIKFRGGEALITGRLPSGAHVIVRNAALVGLYQKKETWIVLVSKSVVYGFAPQLDTAPQTTEGH